MSTFLSWPSATKTDCCCGSLENATSHTAPSPSVVLETIDSFTNFPSFWNTWIRLLRRSQTYTWLSREILTQLPPGNWGPGGAAGSYEPLGASPGFSPYAPQCRL